MKRYVVLGNIILLVLAVGALLLITLKREAYVSEERLKAIQELNQLTDHIRWQGVEFKTLVQSTIDDVLVLSQLPALQMIAGHGAESPSLDSEQMRADLQQLFAAQLAVKKHYLQLRFIGVADGGREIIRAERDGQTGGALVVPQDKLQQKGTRDYFVDTVKRTRGEVYLSDINLNRERGAIEVPHVPVLRAATPVFDAQGKILGIVIANIDLHYFFDEFAEAIPHAHEESLYVINDRLDFLFHPRAGKAFAFEFGMPYKMGNDLPRLTRKVEENARTAHLAYGQDIYDYSDDHSLFFTCVHFDPTYPERYVGFIARIPHYLVKTTGPDLYTALILILFGVVLVALTLLVVSARRR